MDYERSDSSGTDDDLPPAQPGRNFRAGRVSGNGRAGGGPHYGRSTADQQLRKLEQDAYIAVLQAFSAQSEVITWAKEQLMSSLRKELRISEEQHLEFVMGIETNGTSRQIRERRMQGDERLSTMYAPPILEPAPTSAAAASRKKQKTTHVSQAALPPPTIKTGLPSPPLAPGSSAKRAPPIGGSRGKKGKGGRQQSGVPALSSKSLGGAEGSAQQIDPWVGTRVKTRWPADNEFYDAVITDYNPETGLHALVYEMNTANETWEWVNLKELSPRDLKVVAGPPVSVVGKGPSTSANFAGGGRGIVGRGTKKGGGRSGLISPGGRGRNANKGPTSSFDKSAPSGLRNWKGSGPENGLDTKSNKQIQLPSLDALVKEVDKIAEEDDLAKIESVKRQAKEHEEMLRKALAEIGESSEEGESDDEHAPFSHAHSLDRERERRSRQDSRDQHGDDDEDDTAGDRGEGSDGEHLVGDGGVASDGEDDHQDGDDGDDG